MDVILRTDITEQDALKIIEWLNNENITKYLNEDANSPLLLMKVIEEHRGDLLTYYLNQRGRFFLIEAPGEELVGFINLFTIIPNKEYEIVVVIGDEENWNKKYGKKALEKMIKEVFFSWRIKKLNAKIHVDNVRSVRLFEFLGFEKIHTKNHHHHYVINENKVFSKLLNIN